MAEGAGCLGEPGSILACLQGIEDGFIILEASDYGPYANLDAVKKKGDKVDVDCDEQDLGDEAFLPISPREALESGQVSPSSFSLSSRFSHLTSYLDSTRMKVSMLSSTSSWTQRMIPTLPW